MGLKKPNGFALYDMTGNVGEWCWDRKDGDNIVTSSTPLDGPDKGDSRVLKGGGFGMDLPLSEEPAYMGPYGWDNHNGFRICRLAK